MLFYYKNKPIKTLKIPIKYIVLEYSDRLLENSSFVSFLREYQITKEINLNHEYVKEIEWACSLVSNNTRDTQELTKSAIHNDIQKFLEYNQTSKIKNISVRLREDGKFELLDGTHRSSTQYLNGVSDVLSDVTNISPVWEHLESLLLNISSSKLLYNNINHPWFYDWPVVRENGNRNKLIIDFLNHNLEKLRSKVVYDIGCCTGELCRDLLTGGFSPFGLDIRKEHIEVADILNLIFKTRISYYVCDNFMNVILDDNYNSIGVICCLSVLHHWLYYGKDYEYTEAIKIMLDKSQILFIDMLNETQSFVPQVNTKIPFNLNDYITWITTNTGCISVKVLETGNFNRPLLACSNKIEFSE